MTARKAPPDGVKHRRVRKIRDPLVRLMEKAAYTPYGCWEWSGQLFPSGYGKFRATGIRESYAHRWAWLLMVGQIPAGKHLDHLCSNRRCFNPSHLEIVTPRENCRRGQTGVASGRKNKSKTHCRNGHPYEGDNLYTYPSGERGCRECNRLAQVRCASRKRQPDGHHP